MKAVRLHEYGGPEKLQYEDGVPDPSLQPDSILIKTVAASTVTFSIMRIVVPSLGIGSVSVFVHIHDAHDSAVVQMQKD
jgi:hypothetical protein